MTLTSIKLFALSTSVILLSSCNNTSSDVKLNEEKTTTQVSTAEVNLTPSEQVITALFDNDSLLVKYDYSKDIEEKIRRKERSILANRDAKMKDFQELYQTLNQKAPTMTQLEAQQAEQQLLSKQQELDAADQQTQQKYIDWKTEILIAYQKQLDITLENFRSENNIDILIPSGGGITKFYYSNSLDITNQVIDYLNLHYAKINEEKE